MQLRQVYLHYLLIVIVHSQIIMEDGFVYFRIYRIVFLENVT